MSTIPSTFNQRQINKTILGGVQENTKVLFPVSCIVIKRTINQYRGRVFKNLLAVGFEKIISVEQFSPNFNTEQLSQEFPEVKFLSAHDKVSDGELVNLGMEEVTTPYVLVLHDDLCVQDFKFSPQLVKKLIEFDIFCVCPRLMTSERQGFPVRFTPKIDDFVFGVESSLAIVDRAWTLYPYDMAGFYNTDKFKFLGGFDYTIVSPYWQKVDLFLRSWLWGEKILLSSAFSLTYFEDIPSADQTSDISYLKFYLKNLLPVFRNDHGEIPASAFFSFKSRSQCGVAEALSLFNNAKGWVKLNRYRFKTDAADLVQNWDKEGD